MKNKNGVLFCFVIISLVSFEVHAFVQPSAETLEQYKAILSSLNSSIDPCNDFYQYACGNWPQHHREENFGIANMMQRLYAKDLQDIIEKEYPISVVENLEEGSATKKTLQYYYSCVELESVDVMKFVEMVKPAPGVEWPLLEEFKADGNKTKFRLRPMEFFGLLGRLHSLGVNNELVRLLPLYLENGQLVVIFTIPNVQYMEQQQIQDLLQEILWDKESVGKVTEEIFDTQNYWQSIYDNYTNSENEEEQDEAEDEGYTLTDLHLRYPKLYKFLQKALSQRLRQKKPLVAFSNENYYKFLFSHKWPANEVKNFSNYLLLKFIMILKREHSFGCRINVVNQIPFIFHGLYHKHRYEAYGEDLNSHIVGVSKKIYKNFLEILHENHLNFTHRQLGNLQEKLSKVSINIGNLPRNQDPQILENFYRHLPEMDALNYYLNNLQLKQHSVGEHLKCPPFLSCREDPDHIPYYDRTLNMITIPFGTLKSPLYDLHHDALLIYSSLGTILGHELTHAIDPTSLEEFESTDFKSITEKSEILESLSCMQRQQATHTIDERIADLVGTRVAWKAYSMERSESVRKFSELSWQKLFFLNLAQYFCVKRFDFDDEHDAPPMRLNEVVRNFEEFAEAFQCPLGSKMNPQKKCRFY
ncbi:endothelin-converting enzyme homolog [Musca vetustissima]|uniref:endothelin-converting enzyme homolog n=1 Tax=Musca vetustissima TaxID=27455 RepID=UPI002AB706C1|nr:endothelin-converting enzyme homolog [Musca vetustissima]